MNVYDFPTALAFCMAAHSAVGQKRKYTGAEYYTHPIAVATIVAPYVEDGVCIEAALLHDVIEDTSVTYPVIQEVFGDEVVHLVKGLTKVSKPEDGNRAVRKSIDRNFLSKTCARTQTIKYADILHNIEDIVMNAPEFARVYLPEKLAFMEVMTIGHPALRKRVIDRIKELMDEISYRQ